MAIKILIADDHPLIAEGIKTAINSNLDFTVTAIVQNGKEALDFIHNNVIDIALLDVNMPVLDGIACAKEIIKSYSNVKVAMLSMHQEASIIKNLIEIGVKGYMLKTIPSKELQMALKIIYNGKEYFNADVTKALLTNNKTNSLEQLTNKSPLLAELTARELEVIKYISQGLTNQQIAKELFISPRTVDTHRTNIMRKLDVHNVASLIRFAFQNGLTA